MGVSGSTSSATTDSSVEITKQDVTDLRNMLSSADWSKFRSFNNRHLLGIISSALCILIVSVKFAFNINKNGFLNGVNEYLGKRAMGSILLVGCAIVFGVFINIYVSVFKNLQTPQETVLKDFISQRNAHDDNNGEEKFEYELTDDDELSANNFWYIYELSANNFWYICYMYILPIILSGLVVSHAVFNII